MDVTSRIGMEGKFIEINHVNQQLLKEKEIIELIYFSYRKRNQHFLVPLRLHF